MENWSRIEIDLDAESSRLLISFYFAFDAAVSIFCLGNVNRIRDSPLDGTASIFDKRKMKLERGWKGRLVVVKNADAKKGERNCCAWKRFYLTSEKSK